MLRQDTDRACYLAQWGRGCSVLYHWEPRLFVYDLPVCLLPAVLALLYLVRN